ncbi:MAG: TaqI-like C-terminal specificity domain-containing protein [Chloroflexota bacterium]|nr:TaqI-like C-terminal specificity domain-containing protein [Chloroflexota bacterium]
MPDDAIKLILTDLFEPFNFTVMESTPFDQEVAVDPEMLGKVFEELVTGRHESGSYYTPKPVVSFMAREALKGYLQRACPTEAKAAITLFVDEHKPDGLRDAEEMLAALKRVRVCDPACGSGAYLLGMLHELLDLRQALFATGAQDSPLVYNRKLEIIRHSLYGVDNDPFAVNVARLRLWLSLAVEFDGDSPPPLPNLDFKIEEGDSLAAPWPDATVKLTFQDELVKLFRDAKGAYLTAHSGPKDTLRKEIDRLKTDIGQWAHGKNKVAGFDWIVEFAEVFTDGGFDIAIANPPYRRQEGLGAEKLQLERLYPQVYASTADYHVYFYNRSVQLLRDGGVISFITSNKYMRAGYGEKIRGFLPSALTLSQAIDFGDLPVFTAAAYPAIVVGQKTPPKEGHTLRVADLAAPIRRYLTAQGKPVNRETVTAVMERLPVFLGESAVPAYPQVLLRKNGWILEDPTLVRLFDRLMSQGTPLGKFVNGRMYRGVLTGLNDAFVINEAKRQELVKADTRSAEVIKPWLRGRDIKRWRVEPAGLYVLFTRRGINIKQHPAILEHLAQYRHPHVDAHGKKIKGLEPRGGKDYRKPGPYQWYEIQDTIAYYGEFAKPKVVFTKFVDGPRFAFDASGALTNNANAILPGQDAWMTAVLQSKLMWFLLRQIVTRLQNGYFQIMNENLEPLPIISPGRQSDEFDRRVLELVHGNNSSGRAEELEHDLNRLVYQVYGLHDEEVRALEAWYEGQIVTGAPTASPPEDD